MLFLKIQQKVCFFSIENLTNFLRFSNKETGSRNERRLCAVFYNRTPGFETIHGLLDRIMTLVKVAYNDNKTNDTGYYLNSQCEGKIFHFDFEID
jgi:hypothetical protein